MGFGFPLVLISADSSYRIRDFTDLVNLLILRSLCSCFDAVFAVVAV